MLIAPTRVFLLWDKKTKTTNQSHFFVPGARWNCFGRPNVPFGLIECKHALRQLVHALSNLFWNQFLGLLFVVDYPVYYSGLELIECILKLYWRLKLSGAQCCSLFNILKVNIATDYGLTEFYNKVRKHTIVTYCKLFCSCSLEWWPVSSGCDGCSL